MYWIQVLVPLSSLLYATQFAYVPSELWQAKLTSVMQCSAKIRRRRSFPFPEHYPCVNVFQNDSGGLDCSIMSLANTELI